MVFGVLIQMMKWTKIEGGLKNISVGYFGLYGVNSKDEIFTKDNGLE